MRGHDFRALILGLHLKAWRWLHPSRSRLPLDLWWRLAPEIPVVAMTAASLDQSGFQFYNDDGGEATATSIAGEDTNVTLETDTVYHIRIQVDDTASGGENNVQLQLQYNLNGAGWNDVNATSSVAQSSASQLTDQGDTTARLTPPAGGSFITPNGGQDETDGTVGDSNEIDFIDGTHDYVEGVYAFQILSADVANNDVIQFRITRTGGAVLESYTLTPEATVSAAPPTQTITVNPATSESETVTALASDIITPVGATSETEAATAIGQGVTITVANVVESETGETVTPTQTSGGQSIPVNSTTETESATLIDMGRSLVQARPDADNFGADWDTAPTSGEDLFAQIDEEITDDTDYIFVEVLS